MIRGISPVYARKLVRALGEKVFDVIEAEPERLREVTGIGKVRAKRITDAWAEQKVVREIMMFLHSHGVGTARAVRIFRTYGADAAEVMTENPYRLARDIRGIGFVTADAIAMSLGIEKTAMVRVRAGIGHALAEAMDEGHCSLPEEELGPLAARLLEVPAELIRTALDLELADGTVVADTVEDTPCIFLGGLHRAERVIAGRILDIAADEPTWPRIDPDRALPSVERRTGLALTPGQANAVRGGADLEGLGDYRRAGRRQDHDCQHHPVHPLGKGRGHPALRANGAGREADERRRPASRRRRSTACSRSTTATRVNGSSVETRGIARWIVASY